MSFMFCCRLSISCFLSDMIFERSANLFYKSYSFYLKSDSFLWKSVSNLAFSKWWSSFSWSKDWSKSIFEVFAKSSIHLCIIEFSFYIFWNSWSMAEMLSFSEVSFNLLTEFWECKMDWPCLTWFTSIFLRSFKFFFIATTSFTNSTFSLFKPSIS